MINDIKRFIKEQLVDPISKMSRAEQLFVVIIGILGGISPVPMITTAMTVTLSKICNFDLAQTTAATAINVLLTPMQLVFMPIFADFSLTLKLLVGAATQAERDGTALPPSQVLMEALDGSFTDIIQSAGGIIVAATIPWAVLTTVSIVALKTFVPEKRLLEEKEAGTTTDQQKQTMSSSAKIDESSPVATAAGEALKKEK